MTIDNNKKSFNPIWLIFAPIIVVILVSLSFCDFLIYNYIEEDYLHSLLFSKFLILLIGLPIALIGYEKMVEYKKGNYNKNVFSDWFKVFVDLVLVSAFVGFLLFWPVRGSLLIINRTIGHQKEIELNGTVENFTRVKSKLGYTTKLYIMDCKVDRIIDFRVKYDTIFIIGSPINWTVKKGCLGIIYKKNK